MSVHYKFKSAISYDTITFDGLHISVRDLKKAILHQKQIGKNTDFDLQVTNAQTNEEYDDDQTLIPKNTSLIVSRIPLTTQQKKAWERAEQNNQLVLSKQILNLDSHEPDSAKLKGADILGSNASEEDKINAMMAQSTQEYDPSNFVKIRGGNQYGEVPSNYVCHRCHNPGHWIKNCPNNNTTSEPIDIKKATGIPRGFLVPVDSPSVPGAMLTGLGTFAVPSIDQEAYKQSMKPQKKQETDVEKVIIPEDLLCNLCSDLLTDAIMMPCCGTSFCDECIRNALLESEENECPDCHGKEISPETLIPNRYLRNAVNGFKDKTGYSKRIEAAKEKIAPTKKQIPIPQIDVEPPKEEVTIPASTQSPPSDSSIQVPRDEIYQKVVAVGKPIDKTGRNYSAIGTINNLNNNNINNNNSHNHTNFKPQVQSQTPPVSVSNNSRPNNTNVHIPINNSFQNTRHNVTKSTESRVTHISRFNSQSLSIHPHHHMRPCLPVGPADISVPPPPFAHPPPLLQSDIGYNQMQPIHNPPPPGLDRNSSPANASSDEGMHPPESTHHHQMDKFDNQPTSLQSLIRTGYPVTSYYPPPMSNYDPYNIPMDMRIRGFHRGYTRRLTRGQQMASNFRPDYRNGGNYINNKRIIDDPLAVFQRILRERDSKRRDMRGRHSMSRSRSRSLSRSRSRERSRSLSRSPPRIIQHRIRSISRSPLPPRNRSITPRRRSRTRSRSPMRKRKKSLSPVKRLPAKSRRRTRSPSRDMAGRRSRSLSLHRRTRSRSRSLTHRNRMSPSPRFRSRSPTFYSSPARFGNHHREDDHYGPKGGNWRGRGTWNKGIQPYQQSHRHRGHFDGHYDVGVDRPANYMANYAQFDHAHFAMDPNLVRDWDEIRDSEIREREKEKKEEEDKQKKKSKSRSPVKHHKVEKQQRQEHKPSPEKNHKDSDKKDKGKRKKKKDVDLDKKKKKKSREKKENKDDGGKNGGDVKGNEGETTKVIVKSSGGGDDEVEPAAPGTSESPPPFESVVAHREREDVQRTTENEENIVPDELYGDLDGVASVNTTWGIYKKSPDNAMDKPTLTMDKPTSSVDKPTSVVDKPTSVVVDPLDDKLTKADTPPEVLAELPERSKWEVEEDVSGTDDKLDSGDKRVEERGDATDDEGLERQNDGGQISVTNEVLKRAENAIFQKIVRTTIDVSTGKNKPASGGDRSSDGVKENKKPPATEKRSNMEDKKLENSSVKEKKDVSKEKRLENGKPEKKPTDSSSGNRHKKTDTGRPQLQNVKRLDVSSKDNKKPDARADKRLDNKSSADQRSKDRSEVKTTSEKSSRRDDRGGSSTKRSNNSGKEKKHSESEVAGGSLQQDTSSSSSVQAREARKAGNSIQITIPTASDDGGCKKTGSKEIVAAAAAATTTATTTKRISAKERLGEKVDDKNDDKQQHYKTSSSSRSGEKRKVSRSPVRVHSTLIVPEPSSRKIRATSKSRRGGGDSSKKDRNPKTDRTSAAGGSRSVPRRSGDDDKSDRAVRKKSETRRVQSTDRSQLHHRGGGGASSEQQKGGGGSSKRADDRRPAVDKRGDERKKNDEKRGDDAMRKPSSKPSRDEPVAENNKERKNRRLEPDRRVTAARSDDETEAAFDDEPPENDDEDVSSKKEKNKKEQQSDGAVASSSSTSSSSSDSSPVRSKKRKKAAKKRKKKHAKKKKMVVASSSDSDDTDSPSSESDEASGKPHKKKKKKDQRAGKHKSHKKPVKKKSKKSKHK